MEGGLLDQGLKWTDLVTGTLRSLSCVEACGRRTHIIINGTNCKRTSMYCGWYWGWASSHSCWHPPAGASGNASWHHKQTSSCDGWCLKQYGCIARYGWSPCSAEIGIRKMEETKEEHWCNISGHGSLCNAARLTSSEKWRPTHKKKGSLYLSRVFRVLFWN